MWFTSILGIVLGGVMLFYPGGTMRLMSVGFRVFQGIITAFIAYYALSEAYYHLKAKSTALAVIYIILGLLFGGLVWYLNTQFLYYILAFFLFLTGLVEIIGAMSLPAGRFFLILLGIIDLLFAFVVLKYPVVLALVIAWYVLFWGISRLCLAFELRRLQAS
jgi:uncharacterized membrane protein HdeD (DUF308 family)